MVLADGCFDPIHAGHVRYLQDASTYGAVTVRIAPDAAIRAKGRIPFQTQRERADTIASLRAVDDVCEDTTLAGAIRRLRPAYLVKGPDWRGRLPREVHDACMNCGTAIIYTQTQSRTSTERLTG